MYAGTDVDGIPIFPLPWTLLENEADFLAVVGSRVDETTAVLSVFFPVFCGRATTVLLLDEGVFLLVLCGRAMLAVPLLDEGVFVPIPCGREMSAVLLPDEGVLFSVLCGRAAEVLLLNGCVFLPVPSDREGGTTDPLPVSGCKVPLLDATTWPLLAGFLPAT